MYLSEDQRGEEQTKIVDFFRVSKEGERWNKEVKEIAAGVRG